MKEAKWAQPNVSCEKKLINFYAKDTSNKMTAGEIVNVCASERECVCVYVRGKEGEEERERKLKKLLNGH